ncbi:MAG: glutaminyl-peptide cyclotransferase [Sphingomicrobium sp.]
MVAFPALIAAQAVAAQPADRVPVCSVEVVKEYPHDASSFTQGLIFHEGHLYEGSGQYGQSRVARIDLATGKALNQTAYPASQFGEGIVRWRDQLISITWQNGIGHRWRLKDLKPLGTFRYGGEGWGLTMLGDRMVLSDGKPALRFFDPVTMKEMGRVAVTLGGKPLGQINELEAIDGQIWANVWMTDFIVRIDPTSGEVRSVVDLRGLKRRSGADGRDSVLNGIAWDAKGKRLFVTGKYWPKLFEIRVGACA